MKKKKGRGSMRNIACLRPVPHRTPSRVFYRRLAAMERQAPARGRFCGRQTSCHPFCQTAGEENYTNELSVDDLAVLVFKRLQVL